MTSTWTLTVRNRGDVMVGGFFTAQSAREHTAKHFLDPVERWDQLSSACKDDRQEAKRVAETRGKVGPDYYACLDTAGRHYVETVRSECGMCIRVEVMRRRDERDNVVNRIAVVTRGGVFAGFSGEPRNGLSDLRTALRRSIRTIKNPRPGDFLTQAHALMTAQLQGARFLDD